MKLSADQRWDLIDKIAKETVTFGEYTHTLKDAIGELTVKPLTGIPVVIAVLYAFWSIFGSFAGTLVTDGFMVKLFDGHFLPWMQSVFPGEGSWLYYIIVGDPTAGNSFEAFGMLTSGLFVAVGVVLPAVFIFYFMLSLMEDVGYLPRLAVMVDTVLHKIGLHGFAIVPTILSLGCNVPGVESTRILETRKERFMMMTLLAIFIPCGAQLGIMMEVIPDTMGLVLLYLFAGYFLFGYIMNKVIPGKSPEFLIDVPPYRKPVVTNISKKVWGQMKGFFKSAIPFVLLGAGLVNVLYLTGAIGWLGNTLSPLFINWFGVPEETVGPLIAAFLRKDLAVAQLSVIEMTPYQMITAVVLVSMYFPCVATFMMMLKEGSKEMAGALTALFAVVLTYGGLIHLIGILLGVT
ncbi:nucleoside recognition domain-containing protein [Methanohalobium evestigatum]|uniref:nucleoside recognition domain-containing protein n=1 Tax=Methanohalobium evestigatum TaxID=2322 RepID=UPI000677A318|nr:nucleoside recognition domain-containing protein [Methanohalobium evestigatum]